MEELSFSTQSLHKIHTVTTEVAQIRSRSWQGHHWSWWLKYQRKLITKYKTKTRKWKGLFKKSTFSAISNTGRLSHFLKQSLLSNPTTIPVILTCRVIGIFSVSFLSHLEDSWDARLDTLFCPRRPVSSVDPSRNFISKRFREASISLYLAIVSSSSPFSLSRLSIFWNWGENTKISCNI